MSFLHGVLHSIKPKLGLHNHHINEAVSLLEANKHSGKEGFNTAIDAVVQGVRQYNEEVKKSNEAVKSVITTLRDSVGHTLTDKLNAINENNVSQDADLSSAVKSAEALVKTYASKGTDFKNDFRDKIYDDSRDASSGRRAEYRNGRRVNRPVKYEDKEDFKDLNAELRLKIERAIDNIVHEGKRLGELSAMGKSELGEMIQTIAGSLNGLNKCVNDKIRIDVTALVSKVVKRVEEILKSLKSISETLWQYVNELGKWINDADVDVGKAMKETKKIESKEPEWLKQDAIKEDAEQFRIKADFVYKKFEEAKTQVGEKVGAAKKTEVQALETWQKAADAVIVKAQGKCAEILKRVDEKTESGQDVGIKMQAEKLKEKATALLEAYSTAHTQVNGLTKKVTDAVSQLETGMKADLGRLQTQIVSKMKEHVGGMLNDIKGQVEQIKGEKDKETGLEGIKEKVKKYVEEFEKNFAKESDADNSILGKWIDEIAKTKPVNDYITTYAGGKLDDVKNAIVKEIANIVKKVAEKPNAVPGQIKETIGNIKKFLEGVARDINAKLKNEDEFSTLASTIRTSANVSSFYDKEHLKNAAKFIFQYVSTAAKNLAAEIEKLLLQDKSGQNIAAILDKITGDAGKLHSSLEAATTTAMNGKTDDDPPSDKNTLDDKVKNIKTEVNKGMKKDGDGKLDVSTDFEKIMTAYDGKKNNPAGPQGKYAELTEAIPKAMDAFKSYGLNNAGDVDGRKSELDPLVSTITDELQAIAHFVDKGKDAPKLPGPKENGIQDWLNELRDKALGDGTTEWGDASKKSKGLLKIKQEITDALDGIQQRVNEEFDFANKDTENGKIFGTLSEQIKTNLETVVSAFAATGQKINQQLTELKKSIGKKQHGDTAEVEPKTLQKLHDNLLAVLTGPVSNVIGSVTELLKFANDEKHKSIRIMSEYVDTQVRETIEKLTTQANRNYVTSVKEMLNAFASRVQKILQPLPGLIDTDRREGFKGFIRTMQGVISNNDTSSVHINLLKNLAGQKSDTAEQKAELIKNMSISFLSFITHILHYVREQEKGENGHAGDVKSLSLLSHTLFQDLYASKHFDPKFFDNLDRLKNMISKFAPKTFGEGKSPMLLETLRAGFPALVTELGKAYLNVYEDSPPITQWLTKVTDADKSKPTDAVSEPPKYKLTPDGMNGAKIMLTVTPIVCDALKELKDGLDNEDGKWKNYTIYNKNESHHSLHRLFFNDHGYDVGLRGNADSGELNHRHDFNGNNILSHLDSDTYNLFVTSKQPLNAPASRALPSDEPAVEVVNEDGVIPKLYNYLTEFFQVGHIATSFSMKAPCSVYEQLVWLTGLPHNPVYEKLPKHVTSLFEVPDKNDPSTKHVVPIDASPTNINSDDIVTAVKELCETSYAVLTTVVGTGDAECGYACEFPSNSLGLQYPSNPAQCFDTLLDVLRRLFPPLKFLFAKCGTPASEHGWLKCQYGRDVKSTKSQCNEHTKQGTKEPTKCLPKSPLQSYLSDCLIGHLPHNLTSIGCQAKCTTCPGGKPGMPCITPLGFRGFSGSTKTGAYLSSVIEKFLQIDNINCLFAIAPKAPRTLPEHFDFALYIAQSVSAEKAIDSGTVTFSDAFISSINAQSIYQYPDAHDLTKSVVMAYGSDTYKHRDCKDSHLTGLTFPASCKTKELGTNCAPYLSSLCTSTYHHLAIKNSNLYLSWAIYLPWDFWNYLNSFCNAFKEILCKDWGCRGCLRGDKCKPGEHGVVDKEKQHAICQCHSVVECKGVSSTFYQYGFTFGDTFMLNGKTSPRKCSDFCSQLKKVLDSEYFRNLFDKCDEFLYIIRSPFMNTLLALWSLSLLYLLHIAVVRLDVLRIRSHLRSPSSHRIAAQSLLAAARVKALANVKYFSP
ncbi:hypothetical protein, conserved [Babesia ovata]|uniref:C3H1-type domain-containing protein n=1 Tax=Babesia ovata TaxID=189622 RepID=A0A2H6KIX9_9APIC|nr:uncharacterized protein BOVATA_044240 [Babesia ovata]GBE62931.1 hypothetical protein, conserved [Babesia ovata]